VATLGYDWGYDAPNIDTQIDDMYWLIEANKYTIQGINQINKKTILPLGIHVKNDGLNAITIDAVENESNHLNIFLHDKELNIYHNLKEDDYYVHLSAGEYLNRFEITFSNNQTLDSQETNEYAPILVYYSNEQKSIILENPVSKYIKSIEIFNIIGQSMIKFKPNTNKNYLNYNAKNFKTGAYVIKIETEYGKVSKKVLIK
jgi:hypothetical protein